MRYCRYLEWLHGLFVLRKNQIFTHILFEENNGFVQKHKDTYHVMDAFSLLNLDTETR